MRTTRGLRAVVALGAVVAGFSFFPGTRPAGAATGLPPGFADGLVASVGQPTSLTPLADGRVLVTSRTGEVRTLTTGGALSAPLTTVPVGSCTNSERGLLGSAQDPANPASVLLYFTTDASGTCRNRLQQYVLSGATMAPGAVLLDNIPSVGGNHNGGDVHVGKDGFVYVGVGDSGCNPRSTGSCQNANSAARDLSLPNGKILRITTAGDPAPGNPFLSAPGNVSCKTGIGAPGQVCREIYAFGLRNPFRLAFDPNAATTRFFINDVGGGVWEEVDDGVLGADYGWNVREGPCAIGSTTSCGPPPAGMQNPFLAYSHATGCTSIVGGAIVPAGAWPGFDSTYLYADFVCGKIFSASAQCGSWASTTFATDVAQVVELQFVGRELWYTTLAGQVRRIVPPPSPPGGATSRFVPIPSARKLDTRFGTGGPAGLVPAGATRTVSLAPEVPAGAVGAVVNVTLAAAGRAGYVTAWPADQAQPATSTLNASFVGQTVANTALLGVSPAREIKLFTDTPAHLIVDVYGYFLPAASATAGRFQSLPPERVLDTRNGLGVGVPGKVAGQFDLQISNRAGVPAIGASAVALVLTGTGADAFTFASAWPAGLPRPNTSTLNLVSSTDTKANLVVVPLGTGGRISLFSERPAHLIADVAGWFTDGSAGSSGTGLFVPIAPARLHDSRQPGRPLGMLPTGRACTIGMGWAVPAGTAVAANLTAVSSAGAGFLTAFPGGTAVPNSSNLNVSRVSDVVAAQSVTRLGAGRSVAYQASVPFNLIVDVTGYFTS